MNDIKNVRLHPGEYFASGEKVIISTLLGSCVAACLYDPVRKVIGMNHFLLSNRRYARHMPVYLSEAGRYGVHAMEILINEMLRLGARREYIQAKVFGGGSVLKMVDDNFFCVGDINCSFIREFLKNENIRIAAEDLGGTQGRVIHFHSIDFSVHVRKIKPAASIHLVRKEKQFWLSDIESHASEQEPEIWG